MPEPERPRQASGAHRARSARGMRVATLELLGGNPCPFEIFVMAPLSGSKNFVSTSGQPPRSSIVNSPFGVG